MTEISIHNRSSRHQRRWCSVPLDPKTDAGMPAPFCTVGPGLWFVRGPRVGDHTVLWHLFADVQPGEHRADTDTAKPVSDVKVPFQLSSWIADDLRGAVPYVQVTDLDTGAVLPLVPVKGATDGDDVLRVSHFQVSLGGWHLEFWCDLWTMQDVVNFRGYALWSDRLNPAVRLPNIRVTLHCGERFVLHYCGKSGGPTQPVELYRGPILDATPLPFRGAILCAPTPNSDATAGALDGYRMAMLEAAAGGPVTATCLGMVSHKAWLAFGKTDNEDEYHYWTHSSEPFLRGEPYRDLYADRPLSNNLVTGDTGKQDCFGATKWLPALLSGEALYELIYSADDYMLRALQNREQDGSPVTTFAHPDWDTWSGTTHSTSADQLGKSRDRPYGWDKLPNGRSVMVDDQHRGDGPVIAAYALTGDPMLRRCLYDMIEVDCARAFPKRWKAENPDSWFDAPRAGGRLLQSWAKMVRLLPERRNHLAWLARRELDMATAILDRRVGPVRWLQNVPCEPHPAPIRLLDGAVARLAAVPWNEALWVLGAYETHYAWKGIDDALSEQALALAVRHATTILRYGTLRDVAGALLPVNGVKVNADGTPQPAEYYRFPRPGASFQQGPGVDMLVGSVSWWSWFAGAVAVANAHSDDADVQKIAAEVIETHYRRYRSVLDIEWCALPWEAT